MRTANTMMTDNGGGVVPPPSKPYLTPDFVQFCQYYGYTYEKGKAVYYDFETDNSSTILFGISGRAACGYSANASVYLAFDIRGNCALFLGGGLGGGLPSASASVFGGVVSCPDANWLSGLTISTGGTIGKKYGIGGDYIIVVDDVHNTTYHGGTAAIKTIVNIPVPAEMHCDTSYSIMVVGFNIYDNVIRSDIFR